MGYSTGQEGNLPTTFFKVQGLAKGSTEIYFKGTVKEGAEYVEVDAKPNNIFGHLTSVSIKEFEYQEETHKVVRLVLDSATDRVIFEGGFSNMMIGLINTLAGNKEPIDKLALSVYFNKKDYQTMGIIINDGTWEDNNWKFDYKKDLKPKMEDITDKKGKLIKVDKTELIDFLIEEIKSSEFQDKIKGTPPAQALVEVAQQDSNIPDSPAEEDSDLPF